MGSQRNPDASRLPLRHARSSAHVTARARPRRLCDRRSVATRPAWIVFCRDATRRAAWDPHLARPSPVRRSRFPTIAACLVACRPAVPDLPPSPPRDALETLVDRCDRGEAPTCIEVAASLRDRGDPRRAVAYIARACELASPRGCAELATALETGDGVAKNPARALDLRVQSCLGGFAPACRAAADVLPQGQAADFRQRACLAGDTSVCPPAPEPPPPQVDPRDEAAVVLALAARRAEIRGCYEAALFDHPHLHGRITLQIALGPEGLARAVAVLESLDPSVDECVAAIAAATMYNPPGSGDIVLIRWRTVFEPS